MTSVDLPPAYELPSTQQESDPKETDQVCPQCGEPIADYPLPGERWVPDLCLFEGYIDAWRGICPDIADRLSQPGARFKMKAVKDEPFVDLDDNSLGAIWSARPQSS